MGLYHGSLNKSWVYTRGPWTNHGAIPGVPEQMMGLSQGSLNKSWGYTMGPWTNQLWVSYVELIQNHSWIDSNNDAESIQNEFMVQNQFLNYLWTDISAELVLNHFLKITWYGSLIILTCYINCNVNAVTTQTSLAYCHKAHKNTTFSQINFPLTHLLITHSNFSTYFPFV